MAGNAYFQDLIGRLRGAPNLTGFRWRASVQGFCRQQPGVLHMFQIRFIPTAGGRVVPAVGIRIDRVEALLHRASGLEERFARDTMTIGAEVGSLLDSGPVEIPVATPEDVPRAVNVATGLFDAVAIPYFDTYSSLEAVDHLLNDDPSATTPHSPSEWLRASTGLVVATLSRSRDFSALEQTYRSKVARLDRGFYLPQFDVLVADLRTVGSNCS